MNRRAVKAKQQQDEEYDRQQKQLETELKARMPRDGCDWAGASDLLNDDLRSYHVENHLQVGVNLGLLCRDDMHHGCN